jgi:hypothetical protein
VSVEHGNMVFLQTPNNTTDEAVLETNTIGLDVQASIYDTSEPSDNDAVTHEVTADGRVILLTKTSLWIR